MKILYIFPHPDDESFGPASAIHAQLRQGHEVHLLTLTKGGATRQRFRLGLDVEAMGAVRVNEMRAVEKSLGLSSLTILDFEDSGLCEADPRLLERAIIGHMIQLQPAVVVTYAVHGISGFEDHLVTHSVVKRAYLELKSEGGSYLKRLAFFTLSPEVDHPSHKFKLCTSPVDRIDCVVMPAPEDAIAMQKALDCYATYQDTIRETGVRDMAVQPVAFEFFGECFKPPVGELTAGL